MSTYEIESATLKTVFSHYGTESSSLRPSLDVATVDLITRSIQESPDFLATSADREPPDWYKELTADSSIDDVTTIDESSIVPGETTPAPEKKLYETYKLPKWCKAASETKTVQLTPVSDHITPYAEYEKTGFVIFSDTTPLESGTIKQAIAQELPDDVELVVYSSKNDTDHIRDTYEPYVGKDRLHILKINPAEDAFWARDSLPVPVVVKGGGLRLVDAQYSRFQQDRCFSGFFGASLVSHPYFYEGGNFMADDQGNCIIVNACETQYMPDMVFNRDYGCKRLIRLKYIAGIGHVDEVVKFIDSENVVTDQSGYQRTLEDLGYNVTMLPRPAHNYRLSVKPRTFSAGM